MIKAIFFDIDGTLLSFQNHKIPKSALKALETLRSKGIKLFVATGRTKRLVSFLDELFVFDGYILQNGQYCYDKNGKVIHKKCLDPDDVKKIVADSKQHKYPCVFEEEEAMYVSYYDDTVLEMMEFTNFPDPDDYPVERALTHDIIKITAWLDEEHENILLDGTKNCMVFRWYPTFLDVAPKGGGKNVGIDAMLSHFGIALADTMSFGDGKNDIPMLKHTAIGVAMGNADDLVKQNADYVTDVVDNDGLYKALKHFELVE